MKIKVNRHQIGSDRLAKVVDSKYDQIIQKNGPSHGQKYPASGGP